MRASMAAALAVLVALGGAVAYLALREGRTPAARGGLAPIPSSSPAIVVDEPSTPSDTIRTPALQQPDVEIPGAASADGPQQIASEGERRALSVRVFDMRGAPIAGARVSFHATDFKDNCREIVPAVLSNAEGLVETTLATNLAQDDRCRWVFVEAAGYADTMTRLREESKLEVKLEDAVRLHGRVTAYETGAPIVGARLVFEAERTAVGALDPPNLQAMTDADGSYIYDRATPGFAGYVHVLRGAALGFALRVELDDTPEQTLDLVVPLGYTVVLRAVDPENGAPIEGASVMSRRFSGRTGRDGTITIGGVVGNRADCLVEAPGRCTSIAWVESREEGAPAVDVPLLAACRIRATVEDDAGRSLPITDVEPTVSSIETAQIDWLPRRYPGFDWTQCIVTGSAKTDVERRSLVIDGLAPWMRVQVSVTVDQNDSTRKLTSAPVVFEAAGEDRTIVLRAGVTGSLAGIVTPPEARGSVVWRGPTCGGEGYVANDGTFALHGVEAGEIEVAVVDDSIVLGSTHVVVRAGETSDCVIEARRAAPPTRGRVRWSDGAPVRSARIFLVCRERYLGSTSTNEAGEFTITAPSDPQRAAEWRLRCWTAGAEFDVGVGPVSPTQPLVVTLPRMLAAKLRVVDAETLAVLPAIRVTWSLGAAGPDARGDGTALPDSDDTCMVQLPLGTCTVTVASGIPGYSPITRTLDVLPGATHVFELSHSP